MPPTKLRVIAAEAIKRASENDERKRFLGPGHADRQPRHQQHYQEMHGVAGAEKA